MSLQPWQSNDFLADKLLEMANDYQYTPRVMTNEQLAEFLRNVAAALRCSRRISPGSPK